MEYINLETLIGKKLVDCYSTKDNEVHFIDNQGNHYMLAHQQDCCENVYIESINGDLEDLVGMPIHLADESTSEVKETEYGDEMWTFYRLGTLKGYVDIRFNGSSNGYYSINVSFTKLD